MKSAEIRSSFVDYFAGRGHRHVPSSPLVPHGDATLLFYMSEEAQEGRDAYNEKRPPDFSRFPWRP